MSMSSRPTWREESGIALISVMLAIIILGGIAAVFIATAISQTRASGIGRDLENAVHVAEAATDDVLVNLNADLDYRTSYDPGGTDDHVYLQSYDGTVYTDEKAWARAVADDTANQAVVTLSGGGEGVAIRPLDPSTSEPMDLVFGVGYVPSRAAALAGQGRVRVLKLQVQPSVFSPADAFLVNGDLTIGGGASTDGITGNVHSNGNVFVEGTADCANSGMCVRGRLSMTGTLRKGPNPTGPEMTDGEQSTFDQTGVCPTDGPAAPTCGDDDVAEGAAPKPVPSFNAASFYDPDAPLGAFTDPVTGNRTEARWWILCPGGSVKAPSGATPPADLCNNVGGTFPAVWTQGTTANFHGWSWTTNCGTPLGNKPCWTGDKVVSGAYFVYNSNAKTQGGRGAVSILVGCELTPAVEDGRHDPEAETCGAATPGDQNGSYAMSGQPEFVPALAGIHFIADRDLIVNGQSGTELDGFIGAREQVDTSGNGDLNGSIVALNLPTTASSPVSVNSAKGNFKVSYNERLLIALPGLTQITAWNEL